MHPNSKWHDDQDDNENYQPEDVKPAHKKLIRKGPNLAKELRDYHASKTNAKFISWAQKKPKSAQQQTLASKMLQSDLFGDAAKKHEVLMKKFVQTTAEDSINSVVQTIDVHPGGLVSFGGFDKVLKIIRLQEDKQKNYSLLKSLYFEDCPIVSANFVDSGKHLLSFLKKPFVNFFDSEKEKSSCVYKLFDDKEHPEKSLVDPSRSISAVWSKNNITLFDNQRQLKTATKRQTSQVKTCAFFGESVLGVAYENQNVMIFDLRKGITIPTQVLAADCSVLAGNHEYIATGNKYGITELRKATGEAEVVKRYDQLTTEITSLELSDSHLLFGSRWKKNAVRVVDLASRRILPKWPNIKTNLKIVTSARLGEDQVALFGTAHGTINAYRILE